MKTGIRNVLQVAAAVLALGASGFAMAADQGIAGRIAGKAREQAQQASEQRRESRPAQPQRPSQSQPQSRPAQPRAESRPAPRNESRPAPRNESRPAPRNAPQAAAGTGTNERRNRAPSGGNAQPAAPAPQTSAGSAPRSDRGVAGTLIQREYQTRDPRPDRNDRGNDRGRDWDRDRDRDGGGRDWDRDGRDGWRDRPRRTVHVIHHLPTGYRDYAWNGTRYYYYNGDWYRPYGSSYISVSVPYGFFVTTLPGSYTSVWVGGTRYYYSDDYYYTWEPARRGYVVVRSPYGDDEDEYESALDEDLYVYPAEGQSEQQQADDRYECHRWAVAETDYDPIDDEYDADLRQDYLRALTACLTGRGYTVR